jgi:xanthine dehydrogenase molybdopterin-binding subunit B
MPNRFSGGESVQHWLAVDKVRFCGEAICAVVAEDRATAEDAVDLIKVDYEPLPVVTDPRWVRWTTRRSCMILARTTISSSEYERGNVDEAFERPSRGREVQDWPQTGAVLVAAAASPATGNHSLSPYG